MNDPLSPEAMTALNADAPPDDSFDAELDGEKPDQPYEPTEFEIKELKNKVEPGLFQWLWDMYMEKKRANQTRKNDERLEQGARNEGIKRELRDSGRIKSAPLPPEP